MDLKFKTLIDGFGLNIQCPPADCKSLNIDAFRWVRSPIDEELDFLPNHLYDAKRSVPPRAFSEDEKCSRCSISMFSELTEALETFRSLNKNIQSKIGYTHVASGSINPLDGLIRKSLHGSHFSFYESLSSTISTKFKIKQSL